MIKHPITVSLDADCKQIFSYELPITQPGWKYYVDIPLSVLIGVYSHLRVCLSVKKEPE